MGALCRLTEIGPCVDGPPLARGKLKFRIPLVEAAMCPAFDCGYVMRRWP